MPQPSEAEQRNLVKRVAQLRQRGFIPAELLELVEKVYSRQLEARPLAHVAPPDALAAPDLHAQGAPLCRRADFPYDAAQAESLFHEFLALLQAREGATAEAAKTVGEALESGDLTPDSAFKAFFEEDEEFFAAWAERTPDAPRTTLFLTQSSLAPSIAAVAGALAERHDADTVWSHQHCPVCGGLPLIAELRDKAGFRYAGCSFCGTRYRIPRLSCAFCGETDAKRLSYFTAEDETGYRVEVCQSCKLYLKTTDFRELDKEPLPLIDDLESLALDILAGNEGFKRPTLSGLGF